MKKKTPKKKRTRSSEKREGMEVEARTPMKARIDSSMVEIREENQ